jgi:uncharacterized LabA/DUF88 family protein
MVVAHGFVDGGYLHHVARDLVPGAFANPQGLIDKVVQTQHVQTWAGGSRRRRRVKATCVTYYDADHDDPAKPHDPARDKYRRAVQLLPDTHLGFGMLRGGRNGLRQKAVDTLIAVDMLVGAFTRIYQIAILVAGDADFVPVVAEVRRRGAAVIVVAQEKSLSDDLRRAADRIIRIVPEGEAKDEPNGAVALPRMEAHLLT